SSYKELEFDETLKVEVDLKKDAGSRVKSNSRNSDSVKLAELVEASVIRLEELSRTSEDNELKAHLDDILNRNDNRGPPVEIRVSGNLGFNSVRYFNQTLHKVEIILNEKFITQLLSTYDTKDPDAIEPVILAERLYHELGHYNTIGLPFGKAAEEARLIQKDILLHRVILKKYQHVINRYIINNGGFGTAEYYKNLKIWSTITNNDQQYKKIFGTVRRIYGIEYGVTGQRDEIVVRNRQGLEKIVGQEVAAEMIKSLAQEKGVSEEDVLLGRLGGESVLKITSEDIDQERKDYLNKNNMPVVFVMGGNGALAVNLPALMNENCMVIMSQSITDNGGRTGKQEIQLRPGKGRTIGLGDEAAAVCEGFLPDELLTRKIYSNFNASDKPSDSDFKEYSSMEATVIYAIKSKFSTIAKEKGFMEFLIEQLNMSRIIDNEFTGYAKDDSDRAKSYYEQFKDKEIDFFHGKSVRNMNMLALFHEFGAFIDLIYGGGTDVEQAKVAMWMLERSWGIEERFHVVPVALESATLWAKYKEPLAEETIDYLSHKVDKDIYECVIRDTEDKVVGVYGQKFIDQLRGNELIDYGIAKSEVDPDEDIPSVNPEIEQWLKKAAKIIIGPGSTFSSALPQIATPGVAEAIKHSPAKVKIWMFNNVNTEESNNFSLMSYLNAIERTLSRQSVASGYVDEVERAPGQKYRLDGDIYRKAESMEYYIKLGDIVNYVLMNKTLAKDIDDYIRANQLEEYGYDLNAPRQIGLRIESEPRYLDLETQEEYGTYLDKEGKYLEQKELEVEANVFESYPVLRDAQGNRREPSKEDLIKIELRPGFNGYKSRMIYINRYIRFLLDNKDIAKELGINFDHLSEEQKSVLWSLSWAEHDKKLYHERSEAGKWERFVYATDREIAELTSEHGINSANIHIESIATVARKNLKAAVGKAAIETMGG
ncbi:MAG: 2-phospho-L-lactate transferase CofD family protein, partial [Candidatus Omnitrophica bacterium]|nr:2-phospho-L-lactate transferase CofD family protein [Candidatus Omnitrophota bacterium]